MTNRCTFGLRGNQLILVLLMLMVAVTSQAGFFNEKDPLVVSKSSFPTYSSAQPIEWELTVSLSHPVAILELSNKLELTVNGESKKFLLRDTRTDELLDPSHYPDKTVVAILLKPEKPYDSGFTEDLHCQLTLAKGTQSAKGGHRLAKQWSREFKVGAPLRVISIEALDDANTVLVKFSKPIEKYALQNELKVIPPARLNWYRSNISGKELRLFGNFTRGQQYRLSLPDFFSSNGSSFLGGELLFRVPDHQAQMYWLRDKEAREARFRPLVERDSRQLIHAHLVNVEELLCESLQISPLLLPLAEQLISADSTLADMASIRAELNGRLDSLQIFLGEEKVFRPFLRPLNNEREVFFSQATFNEWERFSLPASYREHAETGGIELISLRENKEDSQANTGIALFRITDLAISYKQSSREMLVWITSLATGLPQVKVPIIALDKEGGGWFLGKTDKDGLLIRSCSTPLQGFSVQDPSPSRERLDFDPSKVITLLAATSVDATFIDLNSSTQLVGSESAENPKADSSRRGLLFSERGIYKPGETVHIKGLLRDFDDTMQIVPTDAKIPMRIKNPLNDSVYSQTLSCSAYGSIQDSLPLKSWAKVGQYTISIGADEKNPIATASFQVQDYRPPRHYCDLRFKQRECVSDDYVNREYTEDWLTATAGAHYYAGGPVKHGKLRWQIHTAPTHFSVEEFPDYQFGSEGQFGSGFLESGEALLDESGEIPINIPLGSGALSGEYGLKFSVTALDFDGRSAAVASTWQTRPNYLIGIAGLPDNLIAFQPQSVHCIVLNEKNKPVSRGSLQLRLLSKEYQYVQKRDAQGRFSWTWREVWLEVQRMDLDLQKKGTPFDLTFPDWGDHLVELIYNEESGENYRTATLVEAKNPRRWQRSNSDDYPNLPLQIERDSVDPGESIQIKLRPDSPLASGLFCIEREGIFEAYLFPVNEGEMSFTVSRNMEPNVYVSVLGTMARNTFPRYRQEEDKGGPGFVYGHEEIHVRRNSQALTLELKDGPAGMSVEPGDNVELILKVVDAHGHGLSAELAVGVVDEAVLAMTNWRLPKTGVLLDFDLPLLVTTGDARKELHTQELAQMLKLLPPTGGDGDSGNSSSGTGIAQSVRQDFNPVAYYAPALRTDADGNLRVKFRVPDTMTRYRIYALAADQHSRFGRMEEALTVVRPFYLEPGLPRFLTLGDKFKAELAIFNRKDHSGTISLTLESSSELAFGAAPLGVVVAANDRTSIPIAGEAMAVGDGEFTALATFGNQQDGVRITLPIQGGALTDVFSLTGVFRGNTELVAIHHGLPDDIPKDLIEDGSHYARLTLSVSPFIRLTPGLRYLLRYPYGCVEQTSSTLFPLAGLNVLIEQGHLPGIDSGETRKFIDSGVERLFSMQKTSGGFSYWPGGKDVNFHGSLYALTALQALSLSGVDIPKDRMSKAWDWLELEIRKDPEREDRRTYRAWSLYLLSKAGRSTWWAVEDMLSELGNLPQESRAFTLLAASSCDSVSIWELSSLAREHLSSFTDHSTGNNESFRARYRGKAVTLLALDKLLPGSSLADELVLSILSGMKSDGSWTATSDTGWCLISLASHYVKLGTRTTNLEVSAELAGQAAHHFDLSGKTSEVMDIDLEPFLADPRISLTAPTNTKVYYSLDFSYPLPHKEQSGWSKGFTLSKKVENLNGKEQIQVGDVVKVTLRFDPDRRSSLRYLVVDDPIPAGLVAINSALSNEQVPEEAEFRGEDWYWRWRTPEGFFELHPSHYEIHDDRVLIFADRLWGGPWEYHYYARAVCAGEFVMPASKVHLMYEPEKSGTTALSQLRIEER